MRGAAAFLPALAGLILTGCGTFSNLKSEREVYGGVKTDVAVASDFLDTGFGPKQPGPDVRNLALLFGTAALLDFPFSFVCDTVTLPLTLPTAFRSGSGYVVDDNLEATAPRPSRVERERTPR